MEILPPPPIPSSCDLRDFQFYQIDVARLRDSELMATADAEVFRCAVLSWCYAWHQLPAGSMPDDDATLARAMGFGRDIKGWKKVRAAGGLRGWTKASDGRLYHPVVTEKVLAAWSRKLQQRWMTACARIKKCNQRNGTTVPCPDFDAWLAEGCPQGQTTLSPGTDPPCPQGQTPLVPRDDGGRNGSKGQLKGQGQRELDAAGAASSPERAAPPPADDMFDGIQEPPALRLAERPKNLGDFQALHPRVYVGRDERGAWEATLAEFGWDLMHHAYGVLEPTVPRGKRVLLSMITGWLGENTKPKDTP